MEIRQGYRLTTLRGIDGFLDENADRLPSVSPTGIRRRLKDRIVALDLAAETQAGSTIEAVAQTAKQKELRRVLTQEHLAPLVRIARADMAREPALAAIRRLPPTSLTHEVLMTTALGIAEVAEAHSEVFIAAGLRADFADLLRGAAKALEGSIDERTAAYGHRHGATVGMTTLLGDASRCVCVLDALVRKDLRHEPQLLAAWITVKTPAAKPARAREPSTTSIADAASLMIAA